MSDSITTLVTLAQSIGLVALCCVLSYCVMHGVALTSRKYLLLRIFLFPGVIIHESAHAMACVLTHTKIEQISFWDEAGGSVVHHKPRFSIITQPFISLAPLPVGLALILFLSGQLTPLTWTSAPILLIMISIAATLAPSQTDFVHALEGLVFLFGITLATAIAWPNLGTSIQVTLDPLNRQLLLIIAILATIWFTLLFSHSLFRKTKIYG